MKPASHRALVLSVSLSLPVQALAQTRFILPDPPLAAPTGAPEPAQDADWVSVESWLSQQAGLPPEPSSIPALKTETAELLRHEPGRSLESAVSQAYAKTRRLEPSAAARVERALAAQGRSAAFTDARSEQAGRFVERVREAWKKQVFNLPETSSVDASRAVQSVPKASRGRAMLFGLVSKLGFGFGEPPEPVEPVWDALSGQAKSAYGVSIEPRGWKAATARILRSEPGRPLVDALAAAAAPQLPPGLGAEEFEKALTGEDSVAPVRDISSSVASIAEFDGRLYAGGYDELHVFDGRKWRVKPGPAPKEPLESLVVIDGKLLAVAGHKIYRWDRSRWLEEFPLPEGVNGAFRLAKIGGKLYAFTASGLHVRDARRSAWRCLLPKTIVNNYALTSKGLLVTTNEGVFAIRRGRPVRLEGFNEWTFAAREIGGALYVGTKHGLLVKDSRGTARFLTGQSPNQPVHEVHDIREIEGRVYAAALTGLYVQEEDRSWRKIYYQGRAITELFPLKDGVYFTERFSGIRRLLPRQTILGNDWRSEAVRSLGSEIETPRPAGTPDSGELSMSDGGILKRGRAILSGLASRLGFGFGEPPAVEPVWTELSAWIERHTGIKTVPADLRRETAEAIKAEFDLPIEKALAMAAIKASGANEGDAERLERFVSSEGLSPEPFGFVHWIGEIDGKLYLLNGHYLHVRKDDFWKKVNSTSPEFFNEVAKIDGKMYVKGTNFYEVNGDGSLEWQFSTSFGFYIHQDSERRKWRQGTHLSGGEEFLLTERQELFRHRPPPKDWKALAIEALAPEFERARALRPAETSKLDADESGNIVSRGRTIFSRVVSRLGFAFSERPAPGR